MKPAITTTPCTSGKSRWKILKLNRHRTNNVQLQSDFCPIRLCSQGFHKFLKLTHGVIFLIR